jgi:hypothetical protein
MARRRGYRVATCKNDEASAQSTLQMQKQKMRQRLVDRIWPSYCVLRKLPVLKRTRAVLLLQRSRRAHEVSQVQQIHQGEIHKSK